MGKRNFEIDLFKLKKLIINSNIIKVKDVLGKVISRQRKLKVLSFSITPKKKLYTF